jgi:hypothetical protein
MALMMASERGAVRMVRATAARLHIARRKDKFALVLRPT